MGKRLANANITMILHSRRELLSRRLFNDIVNDKNYKLAELLEIRDSPTLQFVKEIGLKNHLLSVAACTWWITIIMTI
jgi:hypothetical protein